MQFSELSELKTVIQHMRGGRGGVAGHLGSSGLADAQKQPTSPQTSEVDRMLYSSPKSEPSVAGGESLGSRGGPLYDEGPGYRHGRGGSPQGRGGAVDVAKPEKEKKPEKTKVIKFDAEPVAGAGGGNGAGGAGGTGGGGGGAGGDGGGAGAGNGGGGGMFDFAVEAVPSIAALKTGGAGLGGAPPQPTGGLARILSEDSKAEAPTAAALIELAFHLPGNPGEALRVDLFELATVTDAINAVLKAHRREGRTPPLYYGHPGCYEVRMHEGDGFPDEDFPALGAGRQLKDFGDTTYCLCEKAGKCPPPDWDGASAAASSTVSEGSGSGPAKGTVIKIKMPNAKAHTVMPLAEGTTGKDLLPLLAKKHRLQLFTGEYIFRLLHDDQQRLKREGRAANELGEVDMEAPLRPLMLEEVELATKRYADSPAPLPPRKHSVAGGGGGASGGGGVGGKDKGGGANVRPEIDSFMYNDMTASQYKEWNVVKKNKFGKKQSRVMGVDLTKIYNYNKAGRTTLRRNSTVKTPERLISEIKDIRYLSAPCEFQITFKEGEGTITLEYATDTPTECAEIVGKINYIRSRQQGGGPS